MAARLRLLLIVSIGAAIGVAYFWRLADAPIYPYHDEILFAVQAHSISTTFRDVNGNFLPLYIHMGGNYWCSPEHIYLAALLLRAFPISDVVIRVPSVTMGLVSALLMFFLGRRVFGSAWFGIFAAAVVALTPALFIASRFKVESHYPLPFVIGWLLCVYRFEDTRRTAWLFAGGAVLGLGVYSYHASPLMMSLYVVLTWWFLSWIGELRLRQMTATMLGFAVAALPFAMFVITHPEYIRGEISFYGVYDVQRLNPLQGLRHVVTWPGLTSRLRVYYDYFNPSFLFFSGGSSLLEATRQAGVFLLPLAALLPAGIYRIVKHEPTSARLFLAGFFSGPVAAALLVEPYATRRILFMIPFAALVAAYGVKQFLSSEHRVAQLCGVGLVAAIPVCFGYFYVDYMGDYRARSAFWFEYNVRGALESAIGDAIRDGPSRPIFISTGMNEFVEWYWKFYLRKHDQLALESRTTYFDPRTVTADRFPPHALIVSESAARDRLVAAVGADLTEVRRFVEPTGVVSFYVWVNGAGVGGKR
jgi:4-amino-4-deoxy-L-arabinose transferase-like glycosyltransferase